ncbi:peptidoglycan DD-metalloendopeptidase family protein [Acinetobacter sp. 194]|uniref:peptidoglycan DD-metalloendopeptidase family protein n=1 Tax=Acinetobacter shaoyimingii TaxID=2715164 RepID=UPI00140E52CE|nr:peptidoglycan DD-metalloendopeptidase family protein [Acinetobacter shaoyimingii]NHB57751.1 peptidoglycan DD-metalloendopeptidase family protein [Acinetobacter shaoyimingii]
MLLARTAQFFQLPKIWINSLLMSVAVVSAVAITGCASKPQINNPTRYANAPDYYTVRSGDTLSSIATRYGLSYQSIADMNDIAPPYRIYVNQSIRLKSGSRPQQRPATRPLTSSTVDKPIQRQTVPLPSYQANTNVQQPTVQRTPMVQQTVPTAPPTQVATTALKWIKPSNGPVLERFSPNANIKGVRFGGNVGDPVVAAADGQVVYAADGLKEYGNLVLIKHVSGYISAYAHNSKILVKSGQNVTAGQQIAAMGSSGTTRTMLEFQVRLDGKPINPENILPIN